MARELNPWSIGSITFDASAGTVTFGTAIDPAMLFTIVNVTRNVDLYQANGAALGLGGTFSGGNTVLTLDLDTTGHADTDYIQVLYEGLTYMSGTVTAHLGGLGGAATEAKQDSIITALGRPIARQNDPAPDGVDGVVILAKRSDSVGTESNADGDYERLRLRDGRLYTRAIIEGTPPLPTGAAQEETLVIIKGILDQFAQDGDASTQCRVDVVSQLPAGTNNIGDVDVASLPGPKATKALSNANVSASSIGENTLVSGTSGQTIRVFRGSFTAENDVTLTFKDAAGGTTLATIPLKGGGTFSFDCDSFAEPLWVTAPAGAFILSLSLAVAVKGFIQYQKS